MASVGWNLVATSSGELYTDICTTSNGNVSYIGTNFGNIYMMISGVQTLLYTDSINRGIGHIKCSNDGVYVYFIISGTAEIYRYTAGNTTLITTSSGISGTIACSGNGSHVVYLVAQGGADTAYSPNYGITWFNGGPGPTTTGVSSLVGNYDGSAFFSRNVNSSGEIIISQNNGYQFSVFITGYNFASCACNSAGTILYAYDLTSQSLISFAITLGLSPSYTIIPTSSYTVNTMTYLACSYSGTGVFSGVSGLGYIDCASISQNSGILNIPQTLPGTTVDSMNNLVSNGLGTTLYAVYNNYIFQYIQPGTCLMVNTKIDTQNGEINIQDLKKGDLIKTIVNNKVKYQPLLHLGYGTIDFSFNENTYATRVIKKDAFGTSQPTEDIYLTRMHSLLFPIDEKLENHSNDKYISEKKFYDKGIKIEGYNKLLAMHCNKCDYTTLEQMKDNFGNEGKYYHLVVLNNDTEEVGIYASGILVESCSKRWFDRSELVKIF